VGDTSALVRARSLAVNAPRRSLVAWGAVAGLLLVVAFLVVGPIAQPLEYHDFADRRAWLGVPRALDVLSNAPFLFVGALGARVSARRRRDAARAAYLLFFTGAMLTAFGSAWYHLAPDDARLVWDRLPMTVAFTSLLCALVTERIDAPLGRRLLLPLVAIGAASVLYWRLTERLWPGGDLRPYGLVQFGTLAALLAIVAVRREPRSDTRFLLGAMVAYGLAKGFERADRVVYEFTGLVSGHTLKHLAAAASVACVAAMVRAREPEPSS
jgi:hypothetical protein